jgi:tetratricopeptide (TPR) repeat protein
MTVFLYVKNDSLCFHDNLVPYELVDIIFSKLDIRSLLNVDAVGKKFPLLTERAWQYHKEKEKIAYDWHCFQGPLQKWSYHFNLWVKQKLLQGVISHVFTTAAGKDMNGETRKILRTQLDELLLRLALWKHALKGKFYGPDGIDAESAIQKEKEALQCLPIEKAEGGDLLFKGLLYEKENSSELLSRAIQKNMTWASFLQLVLHGIDDSSMTLACAAASKGDYSGLQLLLRINPRHVTYFATHENPPPVLAALISIAKAEISLHSFLFKQPELFTASKLYQEAIDILTSQSLSIPNYILEQATDIKGQLGSIDEAERLYAQCRAMKKDEASSPLFHNAFFQVASVSKAAYRKLQKQEWTSANTLFTHVISCYNPQSYEDNEKLRRILPQFAFVKENQQDFQGACELYNTTILYYRKRLIPVPLNIIGQAIAAMEQLQNWQGAYELCSQEIDDYTNSPHLVPPLYLVNKEQVLRKQLEIAKQLQCCPDLGFFVQDPSLFTLYQQSLDHVGLSISYPLLLDADALHESLGDWDKVDLVFRHLFHVCQEHAPHIKIPTKIPMQAAYVKERLGNLEEAKSVYDDILAQDKGKTPDILYRAGCIEKELGKLPDADKLFSRALDLYGLKEAPLHVLIDAAFVKEQLEKWSEADRIYTEIIDACGENTDPELLDKAACVKVKLGLLENADSLYAEAIKAYGSEVPPSLLEDAARIKEKLGKWEEANTLYTQIIEKCGENTSSEVLIKAVLVKEKLKQKDEALITLLSNAVDKLKIRE